MILCFELTMPSSPSWNGRWSGQDDVHIITKTDRDIGKKRIQELNGKSFFYHWSDGWTACVSCRIIDRSEAARLRRKNRGFSGYDWMVRSIISDNTIEYNKNYG